MNIHINKAGSKGYVLVTALLFFLVTTLAVIAGISSAVFREVRTIKNEALSKQSYFTSESAVEDAAYRIKTGKTLGSSDTLSLSGTTANVTVTTLANGSTEVAGAGDADGTKRTTKLVLNEGTGISFPYALQGGIGGIDLSGGATITGDIYTTGSIRGCSSCTISGAAVAAGKSSVVLDQDNSSPAMPTQSITFGNANTSQDLAQSFTASDSLSLIDIALFIKKVGNPSNATVRITNDNAGKPSSTVLASGSLLSSSVSTSYGWMTITLTANPVISAGTTYWIVVDANTNSSSYYVIGANSAYPSGQAKVGRYGNNSWNVTSPAGLDAYFKVDIGTNQEGITGESQYNKIPVGSAYSYQATYVSASGALYCQIGTQNNKTCDPSRGDPPVNDAPVPDPAIDGWKTEASASVYNGSYTVGYAGATLGPKKILGNLSVGSGATLRVSGTLWVTGDLTIGGGSAVRPDNSSKSYAIVVDGTVTLTGGSNIFGGSTGSHILIISLSSADPAINLNGGANDTIVYIPNGGLFVSGGAHIKAAAAKHITADGGADIEYDPDVSALNLISGSSGGAFGIKSWKETE